MPPRCSYLALSEGQGLNERVERKERGEALAKALHSPGRRTVEEAEDDRLPPKAYGTPKLPASWRTTPMSASSEMILVEPGRP